MELRSTMLRQRLWRWHFLAGLMVCPFAIFLSLTGAIYLFKPQIEQYQEAAINATAVHAGAVTTRLPMSHQVEALLAQHPEATLKKLILAPPGDRSIEIELRDPDGRASVYWLDKFSGRVLASEFSDERFLQQVKKLHSELLLGNIGSYLVELAASWLIIIVVTGLYLWLSQPLGAQPVKRLAMPMLKRLEPSKRWRSLHGVVGFWFSLPILLLLFSGLPWTQLWGGGFDQLKAAADWQGPGQGWMVNLKSTESGNDTVVLPSSSLWQNRSDVDVMAVKAERASADIAMLDVLLESSEIVAMRPPVHVIPPKPNRGVWTFRSMPAERSQRETLHFDQYSGGLIMHTQFSDHHPLERIVSQGIAMHEGALFGWLNQLLGLLTALAVTGISVTGLYLWWRRRPASANVTAAVDSHRSVDDDDNRRAPTSLGFYAGIALLGIFLPAAGISFLAIGAWEVILSAGRSIIDRRRPSKEA